MSSNPFPLESDHRGSFINIGAFFMTAFMCSSVLSKVASKLWKIYALEGDDFSVLAAMVGDSYLLFRLVAGRVS